MRGVSQILATIRRTDSWLHVFVACIVFGWTEFGNAEELSLPTAQRADPAEFAAQNANEAIDFVESMRVLERRIDLLMKQNEDLERHNNRLAAQFDDLSRRIEKPFDQKKLPQDSYFSLYSDSNPLADPESLPDSSNVVVPTNYLSSDLQQSRKAFSLTRNEVDLDVPHAAGGGSKASGGDPTSTGRAQEDGNRHVGKLALKPYYDFDSDGFRFTTEDNEFSFGVRGLVQLDGKAYSEPSPGFASSGFYTPRSRFYFEGQLTKPIQYEFSFQQTYDSVNLLDAYVNFNYDPAFQVRLGRYKTPFTYEWYRVHIWDLLAPERSLFATNFEGQRRFGAMGWGTLFENRVEYAVGSFNTQRNGYQPFNNLQDVMAFVNFKPFYNEDRSFALRDLQFGGSVNAGYENQPVAPAALRTNNAPSTSAVSDSGAVNFATLPFLAFNQGVTEHGGRALWELHTAWYHGGLTVLGAWQSGTESYSTAAGAPSRIPINGWFLQAGYIFTGETIRDRTLIDPLHPFDLRPGRLGFGAFEPTARYSELTLDRRVFSDGLADPSLWTNQAKLVDIGLNWYLNKFVKVYFDWEHAMFGSPVSSASGHPQQANDLFWIRTQIYF
ncbi:OprO/OprP family phosphate-selective porin [Schlesneria paludicola]|uniref:OprO/OprP family phosphate-selective porin n=1 Tax=Schlesneria paludicola TaxID=360056 RepID=UPI0002D4FDB6|nr:porin [Schlesneria paludicola]